MNVASAVAEYLRDSGTRRVYGLPGEDHVQLLHAFAEAGLEYVLARSESAACIMAGVESQMTGIPGVAVVSFAPGLTNAINGIANAYLDRIPLLVLSGQFDRGRFPITIRQALDSHRLVAGITKWSVTAGENINQLLARAIASTQAFPQGPVFLEIPDEVARADAADDARAWRHGSTSRQKPMMRIADDRTRETLTSMIRQAERPVAIIGGRHEAIFRPAIHQFIARYRVPTFTTPSAKGLITRSDEWFAGTFVGGRLEANLIGEADLIVAINLSATDIFNRPWPYTAATIAITDAPDTEQFFPRSLEVQVDASTFLEPLLAADTSDTRSAWKSVDVDRYRRLLSDALQPNQPSSLTLLTGIAGAQSVLPKNTSVVLDAGFSKVFLALLWDSESPNAFFAANGLSTMGYAIPAATAVKLVDRDRVVVAFMGDGSLLMRASEISVAAELSLDVIYVVWMDESMTQIAVKQERLGLDTVGIRLPTYSCAQIGVAFGAHGVDVHSLAELAEALTDALANQGPTLIGVHVSSSSARELFEAVRG